jgi:putative MATE family efflux protein
VSTRLHAVASSVVALLRDDLERRIVRLALPALGTLAVEPLYVLVDTAIVGRLGTSPLAGLALAATVLLTVVSLFNFLEYGVTPDIAYLHGAGRPQDARQAATDALWLACLLGIPTAIVLGLAARPLASVLGGHGAVLAAATTYLRISAVGLPFVLLVLLGHGVMRGVNDLRRPLLIVVVANVANVVLEIIAVYGLNLGVAGSAWSTVIVQILAAGWFFVVLRPHLSATKPVWARVRRLLVTGLHLGIRGTAMLFVWVSATFVAARVDTPTLAAHQVANQVFLFLALALDALAIPAQSLVAGALGAGDRNEAMRIGRICTRLSLWCGGVLGIALAVTSPLLARVFSSDPAVVSRTTAAFLLLAVMQFPGAVAFALDGVLIGGHDERFLGRAAVLNLVSYLPLAAATLAWPELGIAGLWGAQLMWMVMRSIVNQWRFSGGSWLSQVF